MYNTPKSNWLHDSQTLIDLFNLIFFFNPSSIVISKLSASLSSAPCHYTAVHSGCGTHSLLLFHEQVLNQRRIPCAFLTLHVPISPFVCPAFRGLSRVNGKSSASVKASTVPLLLLLILLHYGTTQGSQCA